MQTSDENIYAVGDATEVFDPIFNTRRLVPLAGPANKAARIAADNIAGNNCSHFPGAVGTAIAKVFDLSVGVTGFAKKHLQKKGIESQSIIFHTGSHAGYYPGAKPMSVKLNFCAKTGKVYGAQVVGYDGVDKAIDVFAAACQFGLSVHDLKNLEHAYAPPYSSARSPVNLAGYIAENVMRGIIKVVCWEDVQKRGDDVVVLDVRTDAEVQLGKIEGAYHIPLHELRRRYTELPAGKKIYVYCAVGLRAYVACRILMQKGYGALSIAGGYKTWENATMKQSNEDIYEKYRITKGDDLLFMNAPSRTTTIAADIKEVDACGMQCPGPIMKLNENITLLEEGKQLRVRASDPGFANDVKAWSRVTGNTILSLDQSADGIVAVIRKSAPQQAETAARSGGHDKTIIVFDDDFDRALASFVIANGALSMGRKVTMFFTFWGLNILKKKNHPQVKKDFISRMFDMMLPKSVDHLKMSKLNMFGMGPWMMKGIMKRKHIDSLNTLMEKALAGGAKIIACQMSMDVMGIKREELIDGIEIGGVTYIEASETANLNLFV
jgi:peroxiredoxin family protein/rhodanese-related sulfurtransferase/TusA-related sulfurtransferase